jgi:hypothetical protein
MAQKYSSTRSGAASSSVSFKQVVHPLLFEKAEIVEQSASEAETDEQAIMPGYRRMVES